MNRLRSAELESPAVEPFFAQIVFCAFRGLLTILRPWVSQYATDEGGPGPQASLVEGMVDPIPQWLVECPFGYVVCCKQRYQLCSTCMLTGYGFGRAWRASSMVCFVNVAAKAQRLQLRRQRVCKRRPRSWCSWSFVVMAGSLLALCGQSAHFSEKIYLGSLDGYEAGRCRRSC